MTQVYRTAAAFKQALEERLRLASGSGVDFARRRQLLVFDRFLARVALAFGDAVTLKGGLAVEVRLERARTTKDVDLRLMGPPEDLLERLRIAVRPDLGDFMSFTLRPDDRHPEIRNEAMPCEGLRFRAECALAGKVYGRPFGVDVAFGDPMLGEPDRIVLANVLAFAGVPPPTLRVYPVETHLAEKLHAYTMPRARPNSRVKDLPDLALMATAGPIRRRAPHPVRPIEASRLRAAIVQTFAFRGTHEVPDCLPGPPESWHEPYAAMAREDLLRWGTLVEAFEAARAFLDPVLAGLSDGRWDPVRWSSGRGGR